MLTFVSLESELSLLTSPLKALSFGGALQEPTVQLTPVMLWSEKPLRSHLRQGLPLLSSARRPALMAPVLALGPSLCALIGAGPPKGPFFVVSLERSMVPSALETMSVQAQGIHRKNGDAYRRGFFFGPGFPLGFGVVSDCAADRFEPGFGPGTPFRLPV